MTIMSRHPSDASVFGAAKNSPSRNLPFATTAMVILVINFELVY
jgi:hypothetical protein